MIPVARASALGLAACTAALYVTAFRIADAWPLALVAYMPLAIAIRGRAPIAAAAYGLLAGTLACSVGFAWIAGPIAELGRVPSFVPWLAIVAVGLASGGRFAIHAFASALAARRGASPALAFVTAFVAAEACVPALIPWTLTGAVSHVPVLVQTAELWGEVPIAALLILPGTALADVACARMAGRWRAPPSVAWAAALWVAALAYGVVRMAQVDRLVSLSPRVRVGVIQPDVPLLGSAEDDVRALVREVTMHEDLARRGAELVVWPEGAIPGAVDAASLERQLGDLITLAPALVGVTVIEGDGLPRNAVIAVEAGHVVGRYDKQLLLPFSETLPLANLLPFLRAWSPVSGRYVPGERAAPIGISGHTIGAVVCCEDVVAAQLRAASGGRAELLVSLSNDAWFADPEPRIHLALARLRAVEQRKFMVRATNDGVSAVIDPSGRVVAEAPQRTVATLLAEVRWVGGRTPFDRVGGALPGLAAALLGALLWLGGRRERHSRQDGGIIPRGPIGEKLP